MSETSEMSETDMTEDRRNDVRFVRSPYRGEQKRTCETDMEPEMQKIANRKSNRKGDGKYIDHARATAAALTSLAADVQVIANSQFWVADSVRMVGHLEAVNQQLMEDKETLLRYFRRQVARARKAETYLALANKRIADLENPRTYFGYQRSFK